MGLKGKYFNKFKKLLNEYYRTWWDTSKSLKKSRYFDHKRVPHPRIYARTVHTKMEKYINLIYIYKLLYNLINFENFEGTTKMFNLFNNVGVIALPFNLL